MDLAQKQPQNTTPTYKQSELGLIPSDWEVVELGNLLKFKNGLNKAKDFFGYGTPIVNYMDVFKYRGLYSHNIFGKVSVTNQEVKNYGVKKGDVFFTRTSETVEEIGISSVALEVSEDTVFSGFVLRGRPIDDRLDDHFKKYCFSSYRARKEICSTSSYTTRALTNGRLLSNVKIPIPSNPEEQKTIAEVLSDVDELIEGLEKLIEKKRNLKQGTMQELLTGKTRLSGFSGNWEEKKLGEICSNFKTGKLDANAMKPNGEYRFYTCARNYYYIDQYAFDAEALLVSGNGANVGYVHYYKGKFNAYQRTYVLTNFSADIIFIKLYMERNLAERIRVEVNAGNTPYITMDTLTDMSVFLPCDIEEQTAIAEILSDMDAEIEKLEQNRDKYKNIKQGMMQELLTGRIRLI